MSHDAFNTPAGRRRAQRAFFWGDHAFIRALYANAHQIAPGVWRSVQPSPRDLEKWRDKGVRTIVNLRGPAPSAALFLEEAACARLGLTLVNFRVYSREAPTAEIVFGLRRLFESIEYPALFHCKSGADRVGVAAVLFQFLKAGASLDAALGQLSLRYGHVRHGKTGVIDAAFTHYLAHARANAIALDDVEAFLAFINSERYDPAAIKRDFKANWWGALLTEKLLRRE